MLPYVMAFSIDALRALALRNFLLMLDILCLEAQTLYTIDDLIGSLPYCRKRSNSGL